MSTIQTTTVGDLMERYAALLLDAYGVLVTSGGPLPGARELLERLNRLGKPYYVLTNDASKPPDLAARRYQGFGLPLPAERIISAGSLLPAYFAEHGLAGKPCLVLGPQGSLHCVEAAGGVPVAPDAPFEVLVVADEAGFPFLETVDATLTGLFRRIDQGSAVHLLLPNPDLVYPKSSGFGFASGGIALLFEAALGLRYPQRSDLRFVALGKPQTALFAEAARRCGTRDLVMIGDQLATDIAGAAAFGIDSALLAGGVSGAELPEAGPRPTYLLPSLLG